MATYSNLINKVLQWSNRDGEVFNATNMTPSDATSWTRANSGLIPDFLDYAADKAYRQLRIPATEFARDFCVETSDFVEDEIAVNTGGCTVQMPVPDDLIEVIFIRNKTKSYVFDEKIDMRTFYDRYAVKTSRQFWTRQGPIFRIFAADLAVDDVLEIHYYRRLPALDTNWAVTAATYNLQNDLYTLRTPVTANALTAEDFAEDGSFIPEKVNGVEVDYTNALFFNADLSATITENPDPTDTPAYDAPFQAEGWTTETFTDWTWFNFDVASTAPTVPNWLRDENERVVLFGALAEAFAYLGEEDMHQKYTVMFQQEINELNNAEVMRQASGGNVKINYNSFLL